MKSPTDSMFFESGIIKQNVSVTDPIYQAVNLWGRLDVRGLAKTGMN